MAYTPPSPADIKARFPEFAAVDDAIITLLITEAAGFVDESWREGDYAYAQMYWVAHSLVTQGMGTSQQAQLSQLGGFSRIKSGDLEVSARESSGGGAGAGSDEDYERTNYGCKFLEYRTRSFPNFAII